MKVIYLHFPSLCCNSISNSLEYFVNSVNLRNSRKLSEKLSINHTFNHLLMYEVFRCHYCQFQTEFYQLHLRRSSKITSILFQEMLTNLKRELSNIGLIFQGVSRWTPNESGTHPDDATKIDSLPFKFTDVAFKFTTCLTMLFVAALNHDDIKSTVSRTINLETLIK